MRVIREESFVNVVLWFSPVLSGVIQTMHVAENFAFFGDNPYLFHYSYCANTHFIPDVSSELLVLKVALSLTVPRDQIQYSRNYLGSRY